MLTLLIETSTERGGAFFFDEEKLIFEEFFPPGLHNSTHLLPALQRGLCLIGRKMNEIGLIGVGVGPGSYTGIRVGAMAAMSISYSCRIPLVGISSLDCFSSEDSNFATIIDAKMGGAYLKVQGSEALMCPLNKIGPLLENTKFLVTPNSLHLAAKIENLYPKNVWVWKEAAPDPYTMFRRVHKRFLEGKGSIDGSLELLYMRKTQAEIEREQLLR